MLERGSGHRVMIPLWPVQRLSEDMTEVACKRAKVPMRGRGDAYPVGVGKGLKTGGNRRMDM